jgi:hypothetical protein
MLSEDEIREALRPLCRDETALEMLVEGSMDEYRAIEAAVLAEAAKDREDAERYRFLRDLGAFDSTFGACHPCDQSKRNQICDAAIDAARGIAPTRTTDQEALLAPWPDFAGNPIHAGDTIRHPADGSEGVVFFDPSRIDSSMWRVRYQESDVSSSLVLQIGDKGQAVVVKKAARSTT